MLLREDEQWKKKDKNTSTISRAQRAEQQLAANKYGIAGHHHHQFIWWVIIMIIIIFVSGKKEPNENGKM